jgi:hypothetical protein
MCILDLKAVALRHHCGGHVEDLQTLIYSQMDLGHVRKSSYSFSTPKILMWVAQGSQFEGQWLRVVILSGDSFFLPNILSLLYRERERERERERVFLCTFLVPQ